MNAERAARLREAWTNGDADALKILLCRCHGTLEAIYGVCKLPPDVDRHVLSLLADLKAASEPTLEEIKSWPAETCGTSCTCPSVACPLHGLPPGSGSAGF